MRKVYKMKEMLTENGVTAVEEAAAEANENECGVGIWYPELSHFSGSTYNLPTDEEGNFEPHLVCQDGSITFPSGVIWEM